ncbi:DedA family protein [Leptodesmis sp.]|uniref:DedA family protein n=1 Tax=Leptodesmis sp. TaxID=3100501 RepID=UPI004053489B
MNYIRKPHPTFGTPLRGGEGQGEKLVPHLFHSVSFSQGCISSTRNNVMHFDLLQIIKTFGYLGVWGIVFAESSLLVGFFLPGDSLLFTAGFVASQGFLNIALLVLGAFICAVLGDNVGYVTGHKFGRRYISTRGLLDVS